MALNKSQLVQTLDINWMFKPVLVACEESQAVTEQLRMKGVFAFSNDILANSGPYPEWHIQCGTETLMDIDWHAIIAFPPCTHLASSGARWWPEKQADGRQQEAIDFFMMLANHKAEYIAIENPVGIMSRAWRKPDQYIQPWQHGHGETKKTGLWLKGLPKIVPTNVVDGREQRIWKMPPSEDRAKLRSKTYTGIARAMADQWSDYLK